MEIMLNIRVPILCVTIKNVMHINLAVIKTFRIMFGLHSVAHTISSLCFPGVSDIVSITIRYSKLKQSFQSNILRTQCVYHIPFIIHSWLDWYWSKLRDYSTSNGPITQSSCQQHWNSKRIPILFMTLVLWIIVGINLMARKLMVGRYLKQRRCVYWMLHCVNQMRTDYKRNWWNVLTHKGYNKYCLINIAPLYGKIINVPVQGSLFKNGYEEITIDIKKFQVERYMSIYIITLKFGWYLGSSATETHVNL